MRRFTVLAMVAAAALALTTQASAVSIDNVIFNKGIHRTNGTADGWEVTVSIYAPVLTNARFVNLYDCSTYALTSMGGGLFEYSKTFANQAAMDAEFLNSVSYRFQFNQTGPSTFEDQVTISYVARIPQSFANITNPTHLATGVPLNPLYQWDNAALVGNLDVLGLWVDLAAGGGVYELVPETNKGRTTWQPGPLSPLTSYEFDVDLIGLMRSAAGAPGPLLVTTLKGETLLYYGAYSQGNSVDFTTIPEPASLALAGTAMLTLVGIGYRRRMR